MNLIDDLSREVVNAYKSGDTKKRVFLQTLKAALIKAQKDSGKELSSDAEIRVLKSELKMREQSKTDFKKGEREDLVKDVEEEIELLKNYLPEQVSDEKIREVAKKAIGKLESPDFGQAMRAVMTELKNQADGSRVANIVKEQLHD